MKNLSILILGLFLLSSCEKETYLNYYIDNQSSTNISVNGTDIIHSVTLDHTVEANERKEISYWSKLGKQTDFFEPTSMFGQDLVITNAAGDILTKDYKLLSNWGSNVDDKRTVAEHEYVLIVTDSDF